MILQHLAVDIEGLCLIVIFLYSIKKLSIPVLDLVKALIQVIAKAAIEPVIQAISIILILELLVKSFLGISLYCSKK